MAFEQVQKAWGIFDTIDYPLQDIVEQSVFPVRTPDKEGFLGPLSDLLEEEITLPGEEDAVARWVGQRPLSGIDRRGLAFLRKTKLAGKLLYLPCVNIYCKTVEILPGT